jgi:hypothetical protein
MMNLDDGHGDVMQKVDGGFRPADQEPGGLVQQSRDGCSGSMVEGGAYSTTTKLSAAFQKNVKHRKHVYSMFTKPVVPETGDMLQQSGHLFLMA